MRVETEIRKWGNSLALRVTGSMAELPRFEPGTKVTVDVDSEGLVVRRAVGSLRSFRFPESESELIAGMTAESAHADLLADPTMGLPTPCAQPRKILKSSPHPA